MNTAQAGRDTLQQIDALLHRGEETAETYSKLLVGLRINPAKMGELVRTIQLPTVKAELKVVADRAGVTPKSLKSWCDGKTPQAGKMLGFLAAVLAEAARDQTLREHIQPIAHYCLPEPPAATADAPALPSAPNKTLDIHLLTTPDAFDEARALVERLPRLPADLDIDAGLRVRVVTVDGNRPHIDPEATLVVAVLGCTWGEAGSGQAARQRECWTQLVSAADAAPHRVVRCYRRDPERCVPQTSSYRDAAGEFNAAAYSDAVNAATAFCQEINALFAEAGPNAPPLQPYASWSTLAERVAADLRAPVEALLPGLEAADDGSPTDDDAWEGGSPFPGLSALTERYHGVFAGRDTELEHLEERLKDPDKRFIAVVGPSGSGKSSLVAAGLLPRLRRGAVPGSGHWVILSFKPGAERSDGASDPFRSLAVAMAGEKALERCGFRTDALRQDLLAIARDAVPGDFGAMLDRALQGREPAARLLLYIDQFEELFTMTPGAGAAAGDRDEPKPWQPFVHLLSRAVQDPRARIIVTMRREFAPRVTDTPELAALFRQAYYPLPLATRHQRMDMILIPAQRAGIGHFPRDVAERIVTETADEPGALAITAYTLKRLVDPEVAAAGRPAAERSDAAVQRRLRALTAAELRRRYEALGPKDGPRGAKGAIAECAEAVLGAFAEAHPETCIDQALDRLFGALVLVSDRAADPTRRRARRSDLGAEGSPGLELARLLENEARLLVSDGPDPTDADTDGAPAPATADSRQRPVTIEVAHEALLTEWPLLAKWIEARKDQLWLKHRLAGLTQLWLAHACHRGYLAAAVQVEEMRDAMAALGEALTPEQRAFLDPGFRADWLLQRDLAAWQQAGRLDDRLWGDDRFLGFVPEERAEPDADDEPGEAATPAASGVPQPPELPLLPEPVTAGQWQAQRARRRFLVRSFEEVLADHAGRPKVRTRCAEGLAHLGDPRFDPLHWYLPDDDRLGFREVPAGEFLMGTPQYQVEGRLDEQYWPQFGVVEQPQPLHLRTFYLARWPVTVGQFRAFLRAQGFPAEVAGFPAEPSWLTALPSLPVTFVRYPQAVAYIEWLAGELRGLAPGRIEALASVDAQSSALASAYRFWTDVANGRVKAGLPSEAEWEKAARGNRDDERNKPFPEGRIWPWGDRFDRTLANVQETGLQKGACPVGSFPAGRSLDGCEDLAGNVWEWTRSLWGQDLGRPDFGYPYDPEDQDREDRASDAPDPRLRVLRGGAFSNYQDYCRAAARFRINPHLRVVNVGFRLVWSPYL
jgi:formylglycine-generating enzyme required for sulfatase activity